MVLRPTTDRTTPFQVYTEGLEFKNIDGKQYIEGYIATGDVDEVKDRFTKPCLKDIVRQLESRQVITTASGRHAKVNLEHESVREDKRIIPVGQIVKAWLDSKGAMIRVMLNEHLQHFNEVKGSIKDKHLDAFSIEFSPVEWVMEGGIRVLDKVLVGGAALTGRPINPACTLTDFHLKSFALEEFELKNKNNQKVEVKGDDMTKEVKKEIVETKSEEKKVEAKAQPETQPAEVPVIDTKSEKELEAKAKEITELKAKIEELEKKAKEKLDLKAEVASLVKDELVKVKVKAKDLNAKEEKVEVKSKMTAWEAFKGGGE